MGGDLNLKKSFHPVLMRNQRRVWEEEQKALDERKRTEQMMKERQEERQIQELQDMQEAAGGRKRMNRVDWMYSGPVAGQAGTSEEMEGYLLGKRRVDGLLKGTENRKLEKSAPEESFMALQKANTARDTASKVREDPLLAIKKQEQAAYEALMHDPVRQRLLMKSAGEDIHVMDRVDKRRKHHKHRQDEDQHGYHRRHKRRQTGDEGRHSHRGRHHHRNRTSSSSYSRSPPPSPYRRRSPSPYYRRSRSPPPYHRPLSSSYSQRRSPSPFNRKPSRNKRSPMPPSQEKNDFHKLRQSKSWHNTLPRGPSIRMNPLRPQENEERQAKLAAMEQNASDLDRHRARRIAAIEKQEKADLDADEAARARSAKYGSKGEFMNSLNRKAGELGIGERIRRGRQGMEKYERDND
ncbi:MAG: hypothetical protein LQ351_007611 [Letrouitia transgressa]|nr:MAG: hypothetical protein LQ351_007611 [Letrouitia transgressa]